MQKRIMFVGMDVHQKSIDITTAEQGQDGKVAHFGCIGGDLQSLDTAVDKLMEYGAELRLVYEAGPCGYVIYRHLRERGLHCTVVSPASVPKRPSDRVKTDRRDARTLALEHRAGALRAIYVPEPEDEAIRDLVRGREDAVHNRRRARQRLNSFMLRHGRRYSGKKKWSLAHRRWVAAQSFAHAAQRVTLEEYVGAIEEEVTLTPAYRAIAFAHPRKIGANLELDLTAMARTSIGLHFASGCHTSTLARLTS